jgi:hypothetical protein
MLFMVRPTAVSRVFFLADRHAPWFLGAVERVTNNCDVFTFAWKVK